MASFDYVSDIHLYGDSNFNLKDKASDVLVIAGDIIELNFLKSPPVNLLNNLFKSIEEYSKVFIVLGNHEYYGCCFSEATSLTLEALLPSNCEILNRKIVEYKGIRYAGATLWTRLSKGDISVYKKMMNDRKFIKFHSKHILQVINEINIEHEKDKEFLLNNINQVDVIVSHHSPSFKSYNEDDGRFLGCYCNSLDEFILNSSLKVWIHGHLHNPVNYKIGKVSILSNPIASLYKEGIKVLTHTI